jgi:hypothetical protein
VHRAAGRERAEIVAAGLVYTIVAPLLSATAGAAMPIVASPAQANDAAAVLMPIALLLGRSVPRGSPVEQPQGNDPVRAPELRVRMLKVLGDGARADPEQVSHRRPGEPL